MLAVLMHGNVQPIHNLPLGKAIITQTFLESLWPECQIVQLPT